MLAPRTNKTRPSLPAECKVSNQAATLMRICKHVIPANGGERTKLNGQPCYRAPLQSPRVPDQQVPTTGYFRHSAEGFSAHSRVANPRLDSLRGLGTMVKVQRLGQSLFRSPKLCAPDSMGTR